MPEFEELFREIILDHYRHPRHQHEMQGAGCAVLQDDNPSCGDEVTLYLKETDGHIDLSFTGAGCAISQSSASMLCETLNGADKQKARQTAIKFKAMLMGDGSSEELADLEALSGVKQYPARIKCATLAWNVLLRLLGENDS